MTTLSRQCVILVGGLGTRLGALTAECPKPLLAVEGQPFLGHLIANAQRFGFDKFVLLAGFKAELVRHYAARLSAQCQIDIAVCEETSPAGTAGALLGAGSMLDDEFLLLNGDSIFDFNVLDLAVRDLRERWTGRIALRRVQDPSRYGRVELSGSRISSLQEKTGDASEGLINAGVYWLRRSILDVIETTPMSMERDVFPKLVADGTLHGFEYEGPFIDIGIPEDLAFARTCWSEFRCRPATFFDRDGVLNVDEGYTHKRDEFRWVAGAKNAIKLANDEGRYVFVVTNQAGIARGFYDESAVTSLHEWMNDDLRTMGAHIDDFRFCPHHPDGKVAELSIACACRKPKPGMLDSLLAAWPVDRQASVLIGDKVTDVEAARAAGIRGILFDGFNFHRRNYSAS